MIRTVRRKATEFKIHAPGAKKVSIGGTFNNWDTKADLARKDSSGSWTAKLNLRPGRYEYKFFIDGSWVNDPCCSGCITNAFGTQNCVREIK